MTQGSLFTAHSNTNASSSVGEMLLGGLQYKENLLPVKEANTLLDVLSESLNWQQPCISIAGKHIAIPRLQHWQGDGQLHYRYSGQTFVSEPWHPRILALKALVEASTNTLFNSVLCNLYRNQHDSVSWHADDEPELGSAPIIASVSLGATREFQIKHKSGSRMQMKLALGHNSLLVMPAGFQSHWLHQLPKRRAESGTRINLTFRYIHSNH